MTSRAATIRKRGATRVKAKTMALAVMLALAPEMAQESP